MSLNENILFKILGKPDSKSYDILVYIPGNIRRNHKAIAHTAGPNYHTPSIQSKFSFFDMVLFMCYQTEVSIV
jgi:hypothetical protein